MTDTNVVRFPADFETISPVSPECILSGAIEMDLEIAIVVGMTKDGRPYVAASETYKPDVLWHLAQAQRLLLEIEDGWR